MRRLIAEAPSVYEGYADRLPDKAIEETRLAGRCLAFSLATAAGFHIARATESVVRCRWRYSAVLRSKRASVIWEPISTC